ncbi:hypothetical protein KAU43_04230 [candidate division WOR-3 bacterium]|nr:hypothetical protein [candidate division WOR-3 bacterium]
MKELIRNWNPKQKIRIKYLIDKTHYAYWETTANELYTHISKFVDAYIKKDIKLSNRQLYYRLVGNNLIPNYIEIYKRVCKFLTDLKYGGYIDWDAIEDRGRVPKREPQWDTIQDLIDSAVDSYRLPRWSDQEFYVELYCEKEAMESVLRPIAEKYHVYFGYNKGYTSSSTMYDTAKRVNKQLDNEKTVVLLYLGDHDPSGIDMVRDVEDRIKEFLIAWRYGLDDDDPDYPRWQTQEWIDDHFSVEHIALTTEQVKKYNPPPNSAKVTDPRAKEYIAKHGNVSWELDSLEPEVLMQLTEDAILQYLDVDDYNAWLDKEEDDSKALVEFGELLKDDATFELTDKGKKMGLTSIRDIRTIHCGKVDNKCDCCNEVSEDDGKTCTLLKKKEGGS